jgi:hypothetical protein
VSTVNSQRLPVPQNSHLSARTAPLAINSFPSDGLPERKPLDPDEFNDTRLTFAQKDNNIR